MQNIGQIWENWLRSVEQFQDLETSSISSESMLSRAQEEQLAAISELQMSIVGTLIRMPSQSLDDCIVKLKLWKMLVAPEGVDGEYCSPSDQLGVIAVEELLEMLEAKPNIRQAI